MVSGVCLPENRARLEQESANFVIKMNTPQGEISNFEFSTGKPQRTSDFDSGKNLFT